jgi:hypothetical protein
MSKIDQVLAERGKTHGYFKSVAKTSQDLKRVMRDTPNWSNLSDDQKESLEMNASKVARILNGNPVWHDSWFDLAGYATLVAKTLEKAHD